MTAAAERVVVADRFPATVVDPEGVVIDEARVILTRDEMYVFVVVDGEVVERVRQAWCPDESEVGRRRWTVATADGAWNVERGSGCGCSSPLKRYVGWTPWRIGRL